MGTYIVTATSDSDTNPNDLTLTQAIQDADAHPGSTITFAPDVTTYSLVGDLPDISANVTIEGNGVTLDAAGHRGLFVSSGSVAIDDLLIVNAEAQGARGQDSTYSTAGFGGGGGGGGGAGLGGGLFVGSGASVTLSDVTFQNDSATGGAGGNGSQQLANRAGSGGAGGAFRGNAGGASGDSKGKGAGGSAGFGAGGGGGGGSVFELADAPDQPPLFVGGGGNGGSSFLPVCIKAGALADNVPERDLWISPNHAMYLAGVLIEAKDLINGVSIVQEQAVDMLEYFHVELDSHDVIIAEGALSESFIDDDNRGMFHNAHEFETLYSQEQPAPASYCAPRLDEGYEVEEVRQRLALRTGLPRFADAPQLGALRGHIDRIRATSISGWAQNSDTPEAPVCLDIHADGKLIGRVLANSYRDDLKRAGLGSGRHAFTFTAPAGIALAAGTVEVRRSLDGAVLHSSASEQKSTTSRTDAA
jgi:hypothetical protein